MNQSILCGVWKLVKYITIVEETKEAISLFNEKAIGYLIYMPDGFMSVHIMSLDRFPPTSKLQEKIEVAENYGGYAGRYAVHGNIVTHYPEISSAISYIQIPQNREFKIIGNLLHLEYSHPLEEYTLFPEKQVKAHSTVIWEKV
jgi:hypothetical protein